MKKKKILIVCTGNTCRSPLAMVIISDHLKKNAPTSNFSVLSAGVSAQNGEPASKHAAQVASELGLSLDKHAARRVDRNLLKGVDLILCMTGTHKLHLLHNFENLEGKCFTFAECVISQDISDPYGRDIEAYREIAAAIKNSMPDLLSFLKKFFP
ncbi:MAG: low molecular weight protein arginine phosphatase [Puniceicoccales bacterium]|jgi:protein-tyrosine-phosphatase|nr:low molecular weight protein arginine phosphatase [Puniceicoccales bacterium]